MHLQNCFQPSVFTKRRRKKQAEQTDEIPCHWIWFLINIVRRASSNYGYGNPKQSLKYADIFKHRGAVEFFSVYFKT